MGIVTVVALALLLGSLFLDHLTSPSQFAYYWLAVLILVAWLCVLALADLNHTLRVLRTWQKQQVEGSATRYMAPAAPPRTSHRREEGWP